MQNALVLAANLAAGICSYALHSVLGHIVGPSSYGVVGALLSLLTVLLIPMQIIGTVVIRFGAELSTVGAYPQLNDLIRRLTGILFPVGLITTAVFILSSGPIATFLHLDSPQSLIILAMMFVISFVAPINVGVVQAMQHYYWYSVLLVAPMLLRMLLACGLVIVGFGVNGAVTGIVVGAFLCYFISFYPLRNILSGPRAGCGSLRSLTTYSVKTAIVLGSTILLYNIDTVLAKHFLPPHTAGLYVAIATIGKMVLIVSNSVVTVMFPKFAALRAQNTRPGRIVLRALCSVMVLSGIMELAFVAAPRLVVRVMMGASFTSAAGWLVWYGLAMLLFALAQVYIYYFLSTNSRLFTLLLFVSCIFECALFLIRHQTLLQLVQAVVLTNGVLALILTVLFLIHLRHFRSLPDANPKVPSRATNS